MGHGEPQGIRNTEKAQHREIPLATLNLTDVRRSQVCHGRERCLEETPLLPVLTDGRPKEGE
jgi:hypothetical protein